LPACSDFDIEKMRPEWRDEVYQNWRGVRRLRLKRDGAREWTAVPGSAWSARTAVRPVRFGRKAPSEIKYGDIAHERAGTAVA
jgi:hypothetical protein